MEHLDRALDQWRELRSKSRYEDCSDQPENEVTGVITALAAAIERAAPIGSRYRRSSDEALSQHGPNNPYLLKILPGILTTLRGDLTKGHFEQEPSAGSNSPNRTKRDGISAHESVLSVPSRVTIRWLVEHVGWNQWAKAIGFVVAVFIGGLYMGQVGWVRELLPLHQTAEAIPDSQRKIETQLDQLTKGHNERMAELGKAVVEEEHFAVDRNFGMDREQHRQAAERLRQDLKQENEEYNRSMERMKAIFQGKR